MPPSRGPAGAKGLRPEEGTGRMGVWVWVCVWG